jgi:amino acid transporter
MRGSPGPGATQSTVPSAAAEDKDDAMRPHAEPDGDATRLRELGYDQELKRGLRAFESVAMGFAAISPVVALYGVVAVGLVLAGPAWVWVLPVALCGQCLVLVLYSELSSEFPVANATYQWSRRLLGPGYGWFNGWVGLCSYAVANTTIAYLAAPWALQLAGVESSARRLVVAGAIVVAVCSVVNLLGIDALKVALVAGISAEAIASVAIGVLLLLAYRQQGFDLLTETLGAQATSGGSTSLALLAALAVGGWAFIGFDACGLSAEETHDAARTVPRTVWFAMLSVGAIVVLNAVAITLAHPDINQVVSGRDVDPVSTAVVTSLGGWFEKPFAALTLTAFLACGLAAQSITARAIYSVARDDVLPGSRWLCRVDRRQVPRPALAVTTLVAWAGLLLGLRASAIGSLITFGTAGIYVAFLLLAIAALAARTRGGWRPAGRVRLGRLGLMCNVLAVVWLSFETLNIAWPRTAVAPPGAPWYQVWAGVVVVGAIAFVGLAYLAVARPHDRLTLPVASGERSAALDVGHGGRDR